MNTETTQADVIIGEQNESFIPPVYDIRVPPAGMNDPLKEGDIQLIECILTVMRTQGMDEHRLQAFASFPEIQDSAKRRPWNQLICMQTFWNEQLSFLPTAQTELRVMTMRPTTPVAFLNFFANVLISTVVENKLPRSPVEVFKSRMPKVH